MFRGGGGCEVGVVAGLGYGWCRGLRDVLRGAPSLTVGAQKRILGGKWVLGGKRIGDFH